MSGSAQTCANATWTFRTTCRNLEPYRSVWVPIAAGMPRIGRLSDARRDRIGLGSNEIPREPSPRLLPTCFLERFRFHCASFNARQNTASTRRQFDLPQHLSMLPQRAGITAAARWLLQDFLPVDTFVNTAQTLGAATTVVRAASAL